jgi:hypothetical protein
LEALADYKKNGDIQKLLFGLKLESSREESLLITLKQFFEQFTLKIWQFELSAFVCDKSDLEPNPVNIYLSTHKISASKSIVISLRYVVDFIVDRDIEKFKICMGYLLNQKIEVQSLIRYTIGTIFLSVVCKNKNFSDERIMKLSHLWNKFFV